MRHFRLTRLLYFNLTSAPRTRALPHTCRYNKLCGSLRSFAHRLSLLPAQDPFREKMEGQLLNKLYDMGVLNAAAKLSDVENKLTVAAFCRRRLAVIMCMSKMAETVSAVRLPSASVSHAFVLIAAVLLTPRKRHLRLIPPSDPPAGAHWHPCQTRP